MALDIDKMTGMGMDRGQIETLVRKVVYDQLPDAQLGRAAKRIIGVNQEGGVKHDLPVRNILSLVSMLQSHATS